MQLRRRGARSITSTSRSKPGRRSRCSARADRARRRCCGRSPACSASTAGRVCWDGADLAGVAAHERRFGLMFQEYALFPHRDVAGQRRVRAADDRATTGGAGRGAGRRGARSRRAGRVRATGGRVALGRRAAAGRAGAGAGGVAAPADARRTARRARPGLAPAPARRDPGDPRPGRACRRSTSRTTTRRRSRSRRRVAIMRDGRVVQVGTPGGRVARARRRVDRDVPRLRPGRRGRGRAADTVDTPWGPFDARRRASSRRARSTSSCGPTVLASTPPGRSTRRSFGRCSPAPASSSRPRAETGPPLTVVVAPADAPAVGDRVRLSIDPDALLVYPRRAD